MAAVADSQLVSEEWVIEIEKVVKAASGEVRVARGTTRLPKFILDAKEDGFAPKIVSLGPYHHQAMKEAPAGPYHRRLSHLSRMELLKLESIRNGTHNDPAVIDDVLRQITDANVISNLENFYDWKIQEEDVPMFGWMMMLDAFFLSEFLRSDLKFDDYDAPEESNYLMPVMASVRFDIVKLENQIPIFLLQKVDKALTTNKLLSRIASLSSFKEYECPHVEVEEEQHLLGCMHKYVSSFLQIEKVQADGRGPTLCEKIRNCLEDTLAAGCAIFFPPPASNSSGRGDFLDKYNAKELASAGFSFKSFPGPGMIRFDRHSDTLFLPQIIISDTYTQVVLKNLMALEFNEPGRPKHVTRYVELMNCLIDGPEDVSLLRDCDVICRQRMSITDTYVADMWDGIGKRFSSSGLPENPQGLKSQIREFLFKNYYKVTVKVILAEFHDQYMPYMLGPLKAVAGLFSKIATFL